MYWIYWFYVKGKSSLEYTNLLSPNCYEKNDKMVLKHFQWLKKMKKLNCVISGKHGKFEKPKISFLLEKALVLSIIGSKCKNEDKKRFKEEESIEILKIIGLNNNIEEYQKI